jgi:hypothetical protein
MFPGGLDAVRQGVGVTQRPAASSLVSLSNESRKIAAAVLAYSAVVGSGKYLDELDAIASSKRKSGTRGRY